MVISPTTCVLVMVGGVAGRWIRGLTLTAGFTRQLPRRVSLLPGTPLAPALAHRGS